MFLVNKTELDYMEYANDGAAQTAYVSSDTETIYLSKDDGDDSDTPIGDANDTEYRSAQSFQLAAGQTITAVSLLAGANVNSPTGDVTLVIETDVSGDPSGILADANATKAQAWTASTWNKFTFATSFSLSSSTTYWIVAYTVAQSTQNRYQWRVDSTGDYADGNRATSADGGSSWTQQSGSDCLFRVYNFVLQCYSEDTIIQQGTYSLKVVAAQASLNETLTNTLGAAKDLTGKNLIRYWIRASRTGSNFTVAIHDSGATTSTHTPDIITANTWQYETWLFHGVSDANKDDIDSYIITITNTDAANIIYIDDFYTANRISPGPAIVDREHLDPVIIG